MKKILAWIAIVLIGSAGLIGIPVFVLGVNILLLYFYLEFFGAMILISLLIEAITYLNKK